MIADPLNQAILLPLLDGIMHDPVRGPVFFGAVIVALIGSAALLILSLRQAATTKTHALSRPAVELPGAEVHAERGTT